MFCKQCGKELIDGAQFCKNCGAKVEYNNQINAEIDNKEFQGKGDKNKRPVKTIIACVIGLVLVLIVVALFISNKSSIGNIKVGGTVKFGCYEQDDNMSNGKEDILWDVIAENDEAYMLLSHYVLDNLTYDEWFFNFEYDAFDEKEYEKIEYVDLLCLADIINYFGGTEDGRIVISGKLACSPTKYAKARGVGSKSYDELTSPNTSYNTELFKSVGNDIPKDVKNDIAESWLLGDFSMDPDRAQMRYGVNYVYAADMYYGGDPLGIRPVIWIYK